MAILTHKTYEKALFFKFCKLVLIFVVDYFHPNIYLNPFNPIKNKQWRKLMKIYLSSTYTDLKDYRESVYRTLCKIEGVQVVAMEDYVACDERPVNKCLNDVEKCDIYIGLFAWRYGFIPNGKKHSITNLEYLKAVETNKPTFIFLLDDKTKWPNEFKDKPPDNITILRKKIEDSLIVSYFKNTDDLSKEVAVVISNHLNKNKSIQQCIPHVSVQSSTQKDTLKFISLEKSIDFQAEIIEYSNEFIGREWINDIVDKKIHLNNLLFIAEPGFGKSSIISWLYKKRKDIIGIHFFTDSTPRSLNPYDFVNNFLIQVSNNIKGFSKITGLKLPDYRRKTATIAFRELIIDTLQSNDISIPNKQIIFLIDAIDEACHEIEGESIINILASQVKYFPKWFRIIATSRPDQNIINLFDDMNHIDLPSDLLNNSKDIQLYINRRLMRISSQNKKNRTFSKKIYSLSNGNFLYAKKVLDSLENGSFKFSTIEDLAPGLSNFYTRIFKKIFSKKEYLEIYKPIFSILIAAKEPLSLDIIEKVSNITSYKFFSLSIFLKERIKNELTTYSIYHQSLKDWLTTKSKSLCFYISENDGHKLLSEFGMKEYKDGPLLMSNYSKKNLYKHLYILEQWESLLNLIKSKRDGNIQWDELNLIERWTEKEHTKNSIKCLSKIIKYLSNQNKEHVLLAGLSTQIARMYNRMGKFSNAEKYLNKAFDIAYILNEKRIQAISKHELGSIYLYKGKRQQAIKYYSEALELCLEAGNLYDETAANLIGLAITKISSHKDNEIIIILKKALKEAQKVNDLPHIVSAHRILANIYSDNLDYKLTKIHLKKAIGMANNSEMIIEKIEIKCLMGWIYYKKSIINKKPISQAMMMFKKAVTEAHNISFVPIYISAKLGLVWCFLVHKELNKAKTTFSQIELLNKNIFFHDIEIRIQLGRGVIEHYVGNFENAEKKYKETIKISQKYGNKAREADALVGLGTIFKHQGFHSDAKIFWKNAIQISKNCTPLRKKLVIIGIKQGIKNSKAIPF